MPLDAVPDARTSHSRVPSGRVHDGAQREVVPGELVVAAQALQGQVVLVVT